MKVILIDNELKIENKEKYAVCLGVFDGVHLGHQKLIEKTVCVAKENNVKSAVLTFVKTFEDNKIYPFEENLRIFESHGIDTVFAVDFNEQFKNYSPEYFISKYLIEYIKASFVVCGFNFRFGKERKGDTDMLLKYSEGNYLLTVIPNVEISGETVSSTLVKSLLKNGDIEKVNQCLDKAYFISGAVQKGNRLGRTINFPTANIPLDSSLSPVRAGVYSSRVLIGDKLYLGISNVGRAPTVRNGKTVMLETHILDYEGDLYNRDLKVYLIGFIREEKKFADLCELKDNITKNIETARIQLEGSNFI